MDKKIKIGDIKFRIKSLVGILENLPEATIIIDENEHIVFMNKAAVDLLGYNISEIKTIKDMCEKIHKPTNACTLNKAVKDGISTEIFTNFINRSGNTFVCKLKISFVNISDTKNRYVILSLMDYSKTLRSSDEVLTLYEIIENANLSIVVTDLEGNIEFVNNGFEKITGYSFKEVIGQNPRILKSGYQDELFYKELWDTIKSGQVWKGRFVNKRKDGTIFTEKATIVPIKNANGDIIKYSAIKEDISKLVEIEQKIIKNKHFEYISKLVSRFSHDFNNILTYLYAISDEINTIAKDNSAIIELNTNLKKTLVKAATMIDNLRAFNKKKDITLREVKLIDLFDRYKNIIENSLPKNIVLKMNINNVGIVNIDEILFEQALMNIIDNAKDAIIEKFGSGNGGEIKISTEISELFEDTTKQINEQENFVIRKGKYCLINIEDNGIGIPESISNQIFEPFYTSKKNNTGLGLSSAYGIIKQHNGYILFRSKTGVGTLFTIMLPYISQKEEQEKITIYGEEIYKLPPLKIALVEDDKDLIEEIGKILEKAGTEVYKYSSIEEVKKDLFKIKYLDFLVSDYLLPDGDALELYKYLKSLYPQLKSIIISGYPDEKLRNHPDFNNHFLFLKKPFKLKSLINLIKFILEAYKI